MLFALCWSIVIVIDDMIMIHQKISVSIMMLLIEMKKILPNIQYNVLKAYIAFKDDIKRELII